MPVQPVSTIIVRLCVILDSEPQFSSNYCSSLNIRRILQYFVTFFSTLSLYRLYCCAFWNGTHSIAGALGESRERLKRLHFLKLVTGPTARGWRVIHLPSR